MSPILSAPSASRLPALVFPARPSTRLPAIVEPSRLAELVGPATISVRRRTFRLTDSELERLFMPIARSVGLPVPETRRRINGFRVDFFWPEIGLVGQTDGLRYHRTLGTAGS